MIIIVIITFIILLVTAKFYYFTRKDNKGEYREFEEIPCPKGLPLLGNLNDYLLSPADQWYTGRQRALEFYPIYRLKMLNKNLVFILSPDDIALIFGNPKLTIKGEMFGIIRDWIGPGLLSNEGELWQNRRTLISRMFTLSALDNYTTIFNEGIENFLDEIQNVKEPIDKYGDIGICVVGILSEVISGKWLRMDRKYTESVIKSLKALCDLIDYNQIRPYMKFIIPFTNFKKEQKVCQKVFQDYSKNVVEKLRDTDTFSDEIPPIFNIFKNNPKCFNEEDMKFEINNLLVSGHETIATNIWFTLNLLADYPEHQTEIHQEIEATIGDGEINRNNIAQLIKLDHFVKESMRMYSSLMFIGRVNVEDVITTTGYRIPAGTSILLPIFDIQRNPNVFSEPNVFNPNRFAKGNVEKMHPFAFIAFGVGPRKCIARKYAMLKMKMLITATLRRYKLEAINKLEDSIFVTDLVLRTQSPRKITFLER